MRSSFIAAQPYRPSRQQHKAQCTTIIVIMIIISNAMRTRGAKKPTPDLYSAKIKMFVQYCFLRFAIDELWRAKQILTKKILKSQCNAMQSGKFFTLAHNAQQVHDGRSEIVRVTHTPDRHSSAKSICFVIVGYHSCNVHIIRGNNMKVFWLEKLGRFMRFVPFQKEEKMEWNTHRSSHKCKRDGK